MPRPTSLLIALIASTLIALISLASHSLFGLEWIVADRITRAVANDRPAPSDVTIVLLNDKSLRTLEPEFGRWPSRSRLLLALAIEEIARAGAKLVVVDFLFSAADPNFPEDDRRLAAALASLPTVVAVQTSSATTTPSAAPPFAWQTDASTPSASVEPFSESIVNSAAGAGTIRLQRDDDSSVTRTYPLADTISRNAAIPGIAAEAFRQLESLPRKITSRNGNAQIGRVAIPDEHTFRISWTRRPDTFVDFDKLVVAAMLRDDPSAPLHQLEEFGSTFFRDKIVFLGTSAAGTFDLRATPLASQAPGVEIHVAALETLRSGSFVRETPRAAALAILFALPLLLAFLTGRLDSQGWIAAAFVTAAAATAGAEWIALRENRLFFSMAPAIALLATWAGITVHRVVIEQRQSRYLKSTFGRYVSPQILDHILAHPEKVELGGDRRDLTILFSDIRGFTSISEAAEPEEVVEMLNTYLTRMVDILLRHGGTLDKFIGDAVMGFWNAPTSEPDHARRAVECAIEMIEETARLRSEWEAEGKAPIRIGIGINTGEAVAGNIGSRKVFGYTVIGDAVNLASRLEGKNKDYGTEIIVSESTRERMGEGFDLRYLDDVKVKGKEKAVKIYEVKGKTA